ncbi:MAG: hypothetical protein V4813_13245 [Gemmatimonadota bacterium]
MPLPLSDPLTSVEPTDPNPPSPLERAEAALHDMMLLANKYDVLDATLRQQCLRAMHCLLPSRQQLRPRSVDEQVAQVQRCVDAITRVLPLEAAPAVPRTCVGNWALLIKPPVSRAPKAMPAETPAAISSEALRATLESLDRLLSPMSTTEAFARFTEALTAAPFHTPQISAATVLEAAGPDADLRAYVTGQVRHGRSAGQIGAAWAEEQQIEFKPALRRRIERMVARASTGQSLVDHRRVRPPVMPSCPPLLQALIIKVANGRPGATKVSIARQVASELPVWIGRARAAGVLLDVRPPSNLTVTRYMARWSLIAAVSREEGVTEALKAFKPTDRYSKATTANSVWQLDHVTLDILVMIMAEAGPKVVRPYLTTLTDESTGVCVGWVLDIEPPTSFSTSRVLYRAFTPWRETGRIRSYCPVVLRHDRGRDFLSKHVERSLALLGVTQEICPPRTPNARPELERFFRSLHMGMSGLPGFIGNGGLTMAQASARPNELLTMDDLVCHLEDWTRESNCSVHSGQKETPMQAWERHPGLTVPPDLTWRLLKSDVRRTVKERGIEFDHGWYRGNLRNPDGLPLTELQQKNVRVYYSPDQPKHIWVTEWFETPTGREEAYLGMATRVEAGVPSLNMEEAYEETRNNVRAIARTATAMTRQEDATRQAETRAQTPAPILKVVEHRAAVAASAAQQTTAERRALAAHAELVQATVVSFDDDDDNLDFRAPSAFSSTHTAPEWA